MKKLVSFISFVFIFISCNEISLHVDVESVRLNLTSLFLAVGDSESLVATVLPYNAENKSIVWTSNNKSVATVNNGTVTAVSAGEATIVVTTEDGGKTAECRVIVKNDTDNSDNDSKFITFEDPLVKSALIKQGVDKNNDMEISYAEAASTRYISFALDGYTDVPQDFDDDKWDEMYNIRKFNEFQHFTNVTDISQMFCGCFELEEITLHDNIEIIGRMAFTGCKLTEIKIPASVTKIGDGAFGFCADLENIELPQSLTQIGDYAFVECIRLSALEIPDSVTKIGNLAYESCTNITSIDLSESLIEIGEEAFRGCESLSSIVIPASVQKIGVQAFYLCDCLKAINVANDNYKYHSHEGVLYTNDQELIQYPAGKECSKYEIPYGTICISNNALVSCSLKELIIPDTVIEIQDFAFYNAEIRSIHIPSSIKSIGKQAFNDIKVEKIYTDDLNAWNMMFDHYDYEYIGGSHLIDNSVLYVNNELITELAINTDTNIWAFYGLRGINKITIEEGVNSIRCFDIGPDIKTIVIPTSLRSIEYRKGLYSEYGDMIYPEIDIYISDLEAWCNIDCSEDYIHDHKYAYNANIYLNGKLLTDLVIPESITELKQQFTGCQSIERITFPRGIKSIGNFEGCANLTDVYITSDEIISMEHCFPAGTRIHVAPLLSDDYAYSYPYYVFYAYYFDKTWGISGTFNNWGATPDIEMSEKGAYYVAKDIELTTDSEFKFRLSNNWSVNYGSISTDAVKPNEDNVTKPDGSNIKINKSGKYDIYLAKDYTTFYICSKNSR